MDKFGIAEELRFPLWDWVGGRYSVDFAAKVAIDKYAHHLPLERQVRIMAQHGLIASSQTLWDQVYALATQLEPTWNQLLASLLAEPVIGIEIHAQLRTRTKMFCGCALSFGDDPNTHTCPVCLAHPGALPTLNAEAVRLAIIAGRYGDGSFQGRW